MHLINICNGFMQDGTYRAVVHLALSHMQWEIAYKYVKTEFAQKLKLLKDIEDIYDSRSISIHFNHFNYIYCVYMYV